MQRKYGRWFRMSADRASLLERLKSALESNRLAHAYLLVASPESGLEVAHSIASLILCETQSACGECRACRLCSTRSHPDVLVVGPTGRSAALTVSQIREVIDFVGKKPYLGTAKIVILVEADRMTREAANAFLKTLEEPAGNSTLLLLTERPQALPETVISRSQVLRWDQGRGKPAARPDARLQELLVSAARSQDPLLIACAAEELLQAARLLESRDGGEGEGAPDMERAILRRNIVALLSETFRQASLRQNGNAAENFSLRRQWLWWISRLEKLERLLDRHMDERISVEDVLLP